jgi:hypothetical protein
MTPVSMDAAASAITARRLRMLVTNFIENSSLNRPVNVTQAQLDRRFQTELYQ